MGRKELSWDAIAPMLRGTWTDRRSAGRCLLEHLEFIQAGVRTVWGRYRDKLGDDVREEVFSAVVTSILEKIDRGGGLPVPEDRIRSNAAPWLILVAKNAAWDVLRKHAREETTAFEDTPPPRGKGDEGRAPDQAATRRTESYEIDPAEAIDTVRASQRAEAGVQDEGFPARYRLAWTLFHGPESLDADLVRAACDGADAAEGPVRGAEDTHTLLCRWRETHGSRPASTPSKLALAWILRCDEPSRANGIDAAARAWRDRAPADADRARDLLRQWHNRARKRLEKEDDR